MSHVTHTDRVMSHTRIRDNTNESCHTHMTESYHSHARVMSHTCMRHVAHLNESRDTYTNDMSHPQTSICAARIHQKVNAHVRCLHARVIQTHSTPHLKSLPPPSCPPRSFFQSVPGRIMFSANHNII